jgi:hypothetical protein
MHQLSSVYLKFILMVQRIYAKNYGGFYSPFWVDTYVNPYNFW